MEKDIKLSVVTSYFNRKALFQKTLKSIQSSKHVDNIEVVVVDDGSVDSERLEDIVNDYKFPIHLIRVEPEDKTYVNPCVPFNRAIKQASGELIMLQNPECYHVGDVIGHAIENTTDENYLTYATYALTKEDTESLGKGKINLLSKHSSGGHVDGWYNHSTINPRPLHFTSCITKTNLDELGGFDEDFADGVGFDDDDLLFRIEKKGLSVEIIDSPIVLHQNHYDEKSFENQAAKDPTLAHKNHNLFMRKRRDCFKPKIVGFSQLHNELELGNLENWFKSMEICDEIYIYDQASTDGSKEFYKNFKNVHVIESETNRFEEELLCKQELLEKLLEEQPDTTWIFWMDGDTLLDGRLDRTLLEEILFGCELQRVDGVALGHYNLWRSDKYHRVDDEYDHFMKAGRMAFWRNNGKLHFNAEQGLHKNQHPLGIKLGTRIPFNLIHKGFADDNQIIKKYDNYKSRGQEGWALDRLLNETTLKVEEVPDIELPVWLSKDKRDPRNKKKIKEVYNAKR
jgi:glycosyltransferase involved in cell wall biosynthesis